MKKHKLPDHVIAGEGEGVKNKRMTATEVINWGRYQNRRMSKEVKKALKRLADKIRKA